LERSSFFLVGWGGYRRMKKWVCFAHIAGVFVVFLHLDCSCTVTARGGFGEVCVGGGKGNKHK